jgi:uncharacterized RDD family membrane protein YckC
VARIIDGAVLFIPVLVITAPIAGGYRLGSANVGARRLVAAVVGLALTYGYFVLLEARRGATLGKSAMGLEVRGQGPGGLPTYAQAAERNAFLLLSAVPGSIGGLLSLAVAVALGVSIGSDPAGQGYHDRWAGVFVERRAQTV